MEITPFFLRYIVLIIPFFVSYAERKTAPQSCLQFEHLEKKKKKKTTNWNVALTLFPHFLVVNGNKLCGVNSRCASVCFN